MKSALLFSTILMASSMSFATDGLFTGIHHHYQSPRALGMGDAFVAVANDYSALFYNPAGLARLEEGQINLSIDAAFSAEAMKLSKDINEISNIKDKDEQTLKYIQLLQSNYGKPYSVRLGLFEGIWVRPGWGVGVIPVDFTLDMAVHNQAAPALSARTYLDSTVAYGYADRIRGDWVPGHLFWGATAKFVNRGYFSKDVNALDLAADSNVVRKEDLREGYTVDADLGLLFSPFIPEQGLLSYLQYTKPTFGLVVRNVAETGFGQSLRLIQKEKTEDPPEKLYRVIDIGTRWEYPSFWIFSGRGVMDFRDILHPNYSMRKGFHLGFEFDWTLSSWWKGQYRAGLNQGYFTAGASFLFTVFRLDVVTYGEDVGSYDKPKENRMYMVKMNIDL